MYWHEQVWPYGKQAEPAWLIWKGSDSPAFAKTDTAEAAEIIVKVLNEAIQ